MLGFFLTIILVFFIGMAIVSAIIFSAKSDKQVTIQDHSILRLGFESEIPERTSPNPFADLGIFGSDNKHEIGLNDILKDIRKAKSDSKINGILIDLTQVTAGMATLQEIREALLDFKSSHKIIYAYGEYFSQGAYYLASTADSIFMHPEGSLDFKGLHANLAFFKGALEKLEIEPEIIRHGKYKSAVEPFILDKMSPENREQFHSFVNDIWNQWLTVIAISRGIEVTELQKIADNLSAQVPEDAQRLHLIDRVAYYDEVLSAVRKVTGQKDREKVRLVELHKYDHTVDETRDFNSPKIALIYAVGEITGGEGTNETVGSDKLSAAIRKARLDTMVKAIVLRVNSPGGSALASDVIWREVTLAHAVKPVVVSMGDLAASGGYYISCAADTIIAQPNTLTGSIGVFGLLFNAQKLFNHKLGITFDTVRTGALADIGNMTRPLTVSERAIFMRQVERVYSTFLSHVADGRKMSTASVDSIGQGRVWSGTQAQKIGLVDRLGNLNTAIVTAARMAHITSYRIQSLPEQKDFISKILDDLNTEASVFFTKREMGESYQYYSDLKSMIQHQGIQMRIPYSVNIQ